MRTEHPVRFAFTAAAACCLLLSAGCRQDMHDQAKVETYEASTFFANGMGSRPLPANTVPRGHLREDEAFYSGLGPGGQPLAAFPLETLRSQWPGGEELEEEAFLQAFLKRGQQRFGMFCTPCHDSAGTGNGMIVQRGFKQPTSFHEERLRNAMPGYFVNVMTEGFGQMSSYAAQIKPEDRWAIAAYVRALQLSQHARLSELPADVSKRFEEALAQAGLDEGHGGGGHGGEDHGAADHGPTPNGAAAPDEAHDSDEGAVEHGAAAGEA